MLYENIKFGQLHETVLYKIYVLSVFFANPKVYPFNSNRLKELLCNSNTYSFVFPERFLIFLYIRFHGAGLAKIQF